MYISKKILIIFFLLPLASIIGYLSTQQALHKKEFVTGEKIEELSVQEIGEVAGVSNEAWCDNSSEAQHFEKPISIVWTARMSGCMASCQGASFTKVVEDEKYPLFAGYYPFKGGNYTDPTSENWNPIPEEFQERGLILKITGDWVGIEEDHPHLMFEGKCVPMVHIKKIEIVK